MKCYSRMKWVFMAFSITLLCALWGNSIISSAKTNSITKKEITYQKIEKEIKTSEGEPFMKFSISIPQIKGETEQVKKMFDTATGNRLSLQDVIGGNTKEVREKLLQALKKMKVWKQSGFYGGKTEAKDILMKENVKA